MIELKPKSACDGAAMDVGGMRVMEVDLGILTSLAPYAGQEKALDAALRARHGMRWPAPNRTTGKAGARTIWFGRHMALLAGPAPDSGLAKHAALTDQSDAWACVELSGARAEDVLARLVPVDLRFAQFKGGHCARTMVGHMNGAIVRTGAQSFLIMVFRSMAETLMHDLKVSMEAVASRG